MARSSARIRTLVDRVLPADQEEMTQTVNDLFVGNKLHAAASACRERRRARPEGHRAGRGVRFGRRQHYPAATSFELIVDVYGSEEETAARPDHRSSCTRISVIWHFRVRQGGSKRALRNQRGHRISSISWKPPGLYEMVIEKMPEGAGDRPGGPLSFPVRASHHRRYPPARRRPER